MSGSRRFPFVQLDVFSSRPLEGNMLAVFTDARGMSDAEMQAVARETNLSETTFILPRDPEVERRDGVKVRIYTVAEELEFAGHPTLGTGFFLHRRDHVPRVTLDLRVGKIPVTFEHDKGGFGEMRQRDPEFGSVHRDRETIARVAGLQVSDLDDTLPIETVSTGMAFAIVPVRSLAAMRNLRLNWQAAESYLAKTDAKFLYFVSRETETTEAKLHARMIFYNGEDPATGSAAGCCAAWAVQHGVVAPEESAMIEQGIEVRRPSRIYFRAAKSGASVTNVRVGGYCAQASEGVLTL